MKDKRQRMAFSWPYGDPQMFAYMLSAVAATGYNPIAPTFHPQQAQPHSPSIVQQQINAAAMAAAAANVPQPNRPTQQQQQQPQLQQMNSIQSKISINTDSTNIPLQLNISTQYRPQHPHGHHPAQQGRSGALLPDRPPARQLTARIQFLA